MLGEIAAIEICMRADRMGIRRYLRARTCPVPTQAQPSCVFLFISISFYTLGDVNKIFYGFKD